MKRNLIVIQQPVFNENVLELKIICGKNQQFYLFGIYAKPNIKRTIIKDVLKRIDRLQLEFCQVDIVIAGDLNYPLWRG